MTTIADKLASIYNSKIAIKDAIETKGVPVENAPLADYADKILSIPTGSAEEDYDVEFIDYDGELLIGMSKEEFLALEELPDNPASHENLISDGWNWTFEDAYDYVSKYGMLVIGALYTTKNGASWFTINLDEDVLLEMPLWFRQSVSEGVLVDWGDGTSERFTGSSFAYRFHTYAEKGRYTVTLTPDEGCVLDVTSTDTDLHSYNNGGGLKWNMKREHIVIGKVGTTTRTFWLGASLKDIVYPRGLTNYMSNGFYPYNLTGLVIPPTMNTTVTSMVFCNIYSVKRISLPSNIQILNGNSFVNCYKLKNIIIPDKVTTLNNYSFAYCTSAKNIIIPDSVISIGLYCFEYCVNAKYIKLSKNITKINTYTFFNCFSLETIEIPEGVTEIGSYAFQNCQSLKEINLPESLITIGTNAFNGCHVVEILTIPKNVTTIGNNAFQCYPYNSGIFSKLTELHMKPVVPPTLTQAANSGNNRVFGFVNDTSKIKVYVPKGSLEAYQTATNWTMLAPYMIEEEEE